MMSFRPVFIAVVIGGALVVAAFVINSLRPKVEVEQPAAAFVRAVGKCAECHRRETSAVVHQFEGSRHVQVGVTCLDCHQPRGGQERWTIAASPSPRHLTAANCRQCHAAEYRAVPAKPPRRPGLGGRARPRRLLGRANRLRRAVSPRRGQATARTRWSALKVRRPSRRAAPYATPSVNRTPTAPSAPARHAMPGIRPRSSWPACPKPAASATWGPDHSQIEIYHESKHGVIFNAQKASFQPPRRSAKAHHRRHARADLRHLPHERAGGDEHDARHVGTAVVLSLRGNLRAAAQLAHGRKST